MKSYRLTQHKNTTHGFPERNGSLYISVMGVTLIISMIGLSAMSVARVHLKMAQESADFMEAQHLAFSAVEYGALQIKKDVNWRTTHTSGTKYPDPAIAIGRGVLTYKLVDEDGNLADDTTDSVRLIGISQVGDVQYSESVLLFPEKNGLTCLQPALHCNGNLTLGISDVFTSNQIISSNGAINASATGASLAGDAEAVGSITGSVTGSITTGINARTMPGTNAFDYYKMNGSWIDITTLPVDGSNNSIIENSLLSPRSNPYGSSTNQEGIYVIDCNGANIVIKNSRLVGTLVLLNPGANSTISQGVNWEAAVSNYPALLVEGNINLATNLVDLDESALSVNFNPTGTPYENSVDTDTLDTYPSIIKGLVYVSGQLAIPATATGTKIEGCVVCNTISIGSNLEVNYYNTYRDYPPPGFAQGPDMIVLPGTRRRETVQ